MNEQSQLPAPAEGQLIISAEFKRGGMLYATSFLLDLTAEYFPLEGAFGCVSQETVRLLKESGGAE